jgi:hypothetical protein
MEKSKAKDLTPTKDDVVTSIEGRPPGFFSALQKIKKSYDRPL